MTDVKHITRSTSPAQEPAMTAPPAPLAQPPVGVGAQGTPQNPRAPGLPPALTGASSPRVPSGFAHAPVMAHPPSPPGPSFAGGALGSPPPTSAVVTAGKNREPVILNSHGVSPPLPRMSAQADPAPRAAPPAFPARPVAPKLPPVAPRPSPLAGALQRPLAPAGKPQTFSEVLRAHDARQAAIRAAHK